MTALGLVVPSPQLVAADLLKLRRRRGLIIFLALLLVAAIAVIFGSAQLLHDAHPAKNDPAGGVKGLGDGTFVLALLGAVAAAVVGASAAVGDLESGVYRDLVVTGRSRLALYAARIPAGLAFLFIFLTGGYVLAAVASVVFADGSRQPSISLLAGSGAWLLLEVGFYYLLASALACLLGSRMAIAIILAWRLVLTPLLAQVSALGGVREAIPGVALERLAPGAIAGSVRQGPQIGISVAVAVVVVLVWSAVPLIVAADRECRREA